MNDHNISTASVTANVVYLTTHAPNTSTSDVEHQVEVAATCALTRFILFSVFAGVICIVGLFGNTLSMYVLGKDSQSPVASFMLQWLAAADNLFLVLWGIHFSLTYLIKYANLDVHDLWVLIRVYSYPILFIAQTATIWMTVVIAASRYVSVCIPFRAAQIVTMPNTKKAVYGTWCFSILYNIPRYFEAYLIPPHGNITTYTYTKTAFGVSEYYRLIYFDILYYITSFVLPLVLVLFLNLRLTWAYRKIQKRRAQMRSQRANTTASDNDNNITLVMIIVVLTFIMSQAPARMVQILWEYKYDRCDTVQFILMEISKILEVLNSSINIFIYYGLRATFRDALNASVCPCFTECKKINSTRLPMNDNIKETNCLTTPDADQETTISVLIGDPNKKSNNGVA